MKRELTPSRAALLSAIHTKREEVKQLAGQISPLEEDGSNLAKARKSLMSAHFSLGDAGTFLNMETENV